MRRLLIFRTLLKVSLGMGGLFFPMLPVAAQTGNQSDITLPQPTRFLNRPPVLRQFILQNLERQTVPDAVNENRPPVLRQFILQDLEPETVPDAVNEIRSRLEEVSPAAQGQERSRSEENTNQEDISIDRRPISRSNYEQRLSRTPASQAILMRETYQVQQYRNYIPDLSVSGTPPTVQEISNVLGRIGVARNNRSVYLQLSALGNELQVDTVFPSSVNNDSAKKSLLSQQESEEELVIQTREVLTREEVLQTIEEFRSSLTDLTFSQSYLPSSQKLYNWLIKPLEAQLESQEIETLVFSLDDGLRGLPLGALHDGEQFLAEKYAVTIVPSFGLTDVGYRNLAESEIIAMGASEFTNQVSLPSVPIELKTIVEEFGSGQSFLNENFTIEEFINENINGNIGIIHLATHAEFKAGDPSESYIQFYDRRLNMVEFRQIAQQLGWTNAAAPSIDLFVLSACQTALGDENAELGFTGLALQLGVGSALGSLWYVSDLGTMALMGEFYEQLQQTPSKSQALQAAQMSLIQGQTKIKGNVIQLSTGEIIPIPPAIARQARFDLSHPYFWSAFMLVGNWN